MQHATTEAHPRVTTNLYEVRSGIPEGKVPDFRLQKNEDGGWQVRVVSARASYWLRANYVELCDESNRMDLPAANAFLRNARKDGFRRVRWSERDCRHLTIGDMTQELDSDLAIAPGELEVAWSR